MLSVQFRNLSGRIARSLHHASFSSAGSAGSLSAPHAEFLSQVACVNPPKHLNTLLSLLQLQGEEVVSPRDRKHLNPFLVPLTRDPKDGNLLCYLRWPTQKEDMELQLVRTNEAGVTLISQSTLEMCKRIVFEMDYESTPQAKEAITLFNKASEGKQYVQGEYKSLLSKLAPPKTQLDRRVIMDRFLLTKVGAFPDSYERVSESFFRGGDSVSALITSEKAVQIFYGWGHPMSYHASVLLKLPGREKEAVHTARATMRMPTWTIAPTKQRLEEIIKLAGFTSAESLGKIHDVRAIDPREKDIKEGVSPAQITLDQAAHLMDATALGQYNGDWNQIRSKIADKYKEGGYPDIAKFILTV